MRNRFLVTDRLVAGRYRKEKAEDLTLDLDYTKILSRLGGLTISTSAWAEDSGGITLDTAAQSGAVVSTNVSGGENRNTYLVEHTATLSDGQILKRAISVTVEEVSTKLSTTDYI